MLQRGGRIGGYFHRAAQVSRAAETQEWDGGAERAGGAGLPRHQDPRPQRGEVAPGPAAVQRP